MELICIVCPTGCRMTASGSGDALTISGNSCPRGFAFAKAELTHPVRSLTTTVKTNSAAFPMLPVRTDEEIPKELLFEAMRQLNSLTVTQPLRCGDTVLKDIAGTKIAAVATCHFDG